MKLMRESEWVEKSIRTGQILDNIIAISIQSHRLQIVPYLIEDVIPVSNASVLQNALYYPAAVQMITHILHMRLNTLKYNILRTREYNKRMKNWNWAVSFSI